MNDSFRAPNSLPLGPDWVGGLSTSAPAFPKAGLCRRVAILDEGDKAGPDDLRAVEIGRELCRKSVALASSNWALLALAAGPSSPEHRSQPLITIHKPRPVPSNVALVKAIVFWTKKHTISDYESTA